MIKLYKVRRRLVYAIDVVDLIEASSQKEAKELAEAFGWDWSQAVELENTVEVIGVQKQRRGTKSR